MDYLSSLQSTVFCSTLHRHLAHFAENQHVFSQVCYQYLMHDANSCLSSRSRYQPCAKKSLAKHERWPQRVLRDTCQYFWQCTEPRTSNCRGHTSATRRSDKEPITRRCSQAPRPSPKSNREVQYGVEGPHWIDSPPRLISTVPRRGGKGVAAKLRMAPTWCSLNWIRVRN